MHQLSRKMIIPVNPIKDMRHRPKFAVQPNRPQFAVEPLTLKPQVIINGLDSQPNLPSYKSAIHEGLTNRYQGSTDIARIPNSYVDIKPIPSAYKVTAPTPASQ